MREIYNEKQTTINTNDSGAKTTSLELISCDEVTILAFASSGEHANHVLEVWGAAMLENKTPSDFVLIPNTEIPQLTCKIFDIKGFAYIQVRVKTVETIDSVTGVVINPFRNI